MLMTLAIITSMSPFMSTKLIAVSILDTLFVGAMLVANISNASGCSMGRLATARRCGTCNGLVFDLVFQIQSPQV